MAAAIAPEISPSPQPLPHFVPAHQPWIHPWIDALKQAILRYPAVPSGHTVEICSVDALGDRLSGLSPDAYHLCLLTLEVPEAIAAALPNAVLTIYKQCQDVAGLRQTVQTTWGTPTGSGNLWLPIVLTARGPLYAEAIALSDDTQLQPASDAPDAGACPYAQPIHLSDALRQPIYRLGGALLRQLNAPPSVYLMQFSMAAAGPVFDRLWPFPTLAAIASLGIQAPDLMSCYWHCLAGQPVLDIAIATPTPYWTLRQG